MIPWEDYIHDAPTHVGGQVSINHKACTAGEDTRGRLYIKRASPDLILAYCHNCGDKGYYVSGYSNVNSYRKTESGEKAIVEEAPVKHRPPYDILSHPAGWPTEARDWVQQYIAADDPRNYLGYSPSRRRLYIPLIQPDGTIGGYQLRKIFPDDPLPKYLSFFNTGMVKFYKDAGTAETVVICEDLISAIKLHQIGAHPYCLCGANFDIGEFLVHKRIYSPDTENIMVWLDNDRREIIDMAVRTTNLLHLAYPPSNGKVTNIEMVRSTTEPKKVSDSHLKDWLRAVVAYRKVKEAQND